MPEAFDPYYKWLGIHPEEQPADHYRLLGIQQFEPDPDVICHAADRQMAHLRTMQTGKHAAESQKLLNELAAARVRLLDAGKKEVYDRDLRTRLSPAAPPVIPASIPPPTSYPVESPLNFLTEITSLAASRAERRRKDRSATWLVVVGIVAAMLVISVWAVVLRPGADRSVSKGQPTGQGLTKGSTGDEKPPKKKPTGTKPTGTKPIETPAEPSFGPLIGTDPIGPPPESPPSAPSFDSSSTDTAGPLAPSGAPVGNSLTLRPVPDQASQEAALAQIKSVMREDISKAKKPAEKAALAARLFQQAGDTKDEPAMRFVLLRMARDLGAEGGDATMAVRAVDAIALGHAVDAALMKADALARVAEVTLSTAGVQTLGESLSQLLDEAVAADRYDVANRLLQAARDLVRKTKSPQLSAAVMARAKNVRAREKAFAAVEGLPRALEQRPDDPQINQTLGQYYCFKKGRWAQGLPMLAKGGDPELKAVVEKDLAGASMAEKQAELGDAWWALGETAESPRKVAMRERARFWYEQAIPALEGLAKVRVQNQVARLFGKPRIWETTALRPGVSLGSEPSNVGPLFTLEFWFCTTADEGALLTKRHVPDDASLTVWLSQGRPLVIAEANSYRLDGQSSVKVNDGNWHHVAVIKWNRQVQLWVDGKPAARMETRDAFVSKSPWILGYHGVFRGGQLEARFCRIRISGTARYGEAFVPRRDYDKDARTLLMQ